MVSKDFFKQLEEVAEEYNISVEQVLEAFRKGLINAYKRTYGNTSVKVEYKPEKNEIKMRSLRLVVEDLNDAPFDSEILPILKSEAKKKNARAKVGEILEEEVNIKDFGRAAAIQAKQILNQNIKGFVKDNSYLYYKNLENDMVRALITGIDDAHYVLKFGPAGQEVTTLLPKKEVLKDDYNVGDQINVYITRVEQGTKSPKVFVSKNDKHLVIRLLERNVTEIQDGTIEIKGIARDPGDRCKIAVYSNDPNVEPIGACVGEGGSRIRDVVNALQGEKIDLYEWSDDPKTLIANSLQPTKVIAVINVDPKTKTSLAIVPDSQLSLAIGKNGQNVRLAVQSCDWKIDIKSESLAREQGYEWE